MAHDLGLPTSSSSPFNKQQIRPSRSLDSQNSSHISDLPTVFANSAATAIVQKSDFNTPSDTAGAMTAASPFSRRMARYNNNSPATINDTKTQNLVIEKTLPPTGSKNSHRSTMLQQGAGNGQSSQVSTNDGRGVPQQAQGMRGPYNDGYQSHPVGANAYGNGVPISNGTGNADNGVFSLKMCIDCGSYDFNKDPKYYMDNFNDQSWSCSFGTSEENGIWMNTKDQAGTIMAVLVWFLLIYSAVTITFLANTESIPISLSMPYCMLCAFALASHAKTTFTDPGAVPQSAVPIESLRQSGTGHSMCSQCQTFKPPQSHHCRICNRCVSKMDHHCPWMNNCVGAANLKHFILFLIYTWICSAFALCLLGWNYFMCASDDCEFNVILTQLVRVMTVLGVGAFLFTSSMLMNVCYGIMTGIGTIDRLKKKATNTMNQSDEEPIPLIDVFGVQGYYTWPLPVDPIFEDFDRVMGYSTPQRLLREQLRDNPNISREQYSGYSNEPV
uniref:Palmitoyltransferase n=1 Tax=Corethron hystrix TaxID=216773 RepID=A0A7S1FSP2_9STRA|mmetsp:Transcript_24587/g.56284  ORF Transcript_24587/g.56284 Transcript_24587/m.56284 type:complete len:500 (+) Transcript_24587:2155-3654(+)|eukprot:CAMPEP_0113301152 /NCGR_PEP_ID=MMETSP0010_2-20120614/2500_1 /TAXON_ID=216773 ORGANISM="Corethron hystrix, Strain 308" /NCGR_SAMPLE_ID=MMETSP0010_2 /ASSEMBLY_ACC=CAM_ASM_000155 /LENGTH=499 /DNA_ID=CAMNT_0000154727 /DNA_START=1867 /DNA_END=3366 /DNA_ORIENTATION=+ /assembly_acc=CAM_ASM_000155